MPAASFSQGEVGFRIDVRPTNHDANALSDHPLTQWADGSGKGGGGFYC